MPPLSTMTGKRPNDCSLSLLSFPPYPVFTIITASISIPRATTAYTETSKQANLQCFSATFSARSLWLRSLRRPSQSRSPPLTTAAKVSLPPKRSSSARPSPSQPGQRSGSKPTAGPLLRTSSARSTMPARGTLPVTPTLWLTPNPRPSLAGRTSEATDSRSLAITSLVKPILWPRLRLSLAGRMSVATDSTGLSVGFLRCPRLSRTPFLLIGLSSRAVRRSSRASLNPPVKPMMTRKSRASSLAIPAPKTSRSLTLAMRRSIPRSKVF